jgi:hypothetical protein
MLRARAWMWKERRREWVVFFVRSLSLSLFACVCVTIFFFFKSRKKREERKKKEDTYYLSVLYIVCE